MYGVLLLLVYVREGVLLVLVCGIGVITVVVMLVSMIMFVFFAGGGCVVADTVVIYGAVQDVGGWSVVHVPVSGATVDGI